MRRRPFVILPLALLVGCVTRGPDPSRRARVTPADPSLARNDHYFAMPGVASVQWPSYPTIWAAARQVMTDRGFTVARSDYRGGTIETDPLVSAQFFEPWRQDVVTTESRVQSTLQTVRRTVRFDITPAAGGTFELVPKVVVERQSFLERRVTAPVRLSLALTGVAVQGNQLTDEGQGLQDNYWYAIGRDEALERSLADELRTVIREGPRTGR